MFFKISHFNLFGCHGENMTESEGNAQMLSNYSHSFHYLGVPIHIGKTCKINSPKTYSSIHGVFSLEGYTQYCPGLTLKSLRTIYSAGESNLGWM